MFQSFYVLAVLPYGHNGYCFAFNKIDYLIQFGSYRTVSDTSFGVFHKDSTQFWKVFQ